MIGKNYKIIIKKLYDILLSKSQRPKLLMGGRRWEKGGFEGKKRERKGDRRGKKKKG